MNSDNVGNLIQSVRRDSPSSTTDKEVSGNETSIDASGSSRTTGKKRRLEDNNGSQKTLNESSTIDDLANIDASTYIAWVNRQSQALPNVFVAKETTPDTEWKGTQHNEDPIDGSAATLQVLLSKQMAIHPAPTRRHLPPPDTDAEGSSCSQWVSTTISNFSELRSQIEQAQSQMSQQERSIAVPRMKDRAAWHVFCLGKEEARGNVGGFFEDSESEVDDNDRDTNAEEMNIVSTEDATKVDGDNSNNHLQLNEEVSEPISNIYNPNLVPPNGYPPSLSLLLQFDQVLTRFLFHHHIYFLCEWKSPLTHNRAAWIYALLARMEKPWHREECSAVRRLLRECCTRRWELTLPKEDSKIELTDVSMNALLDNDTVGVVKHDGDSNAWGQLALLNTLIAVTGLYYEQGSMAGGDGMDALFSVPKDVNT